MTALAQIAADDVLDTAYEWLCQPRRDYSADVDLWAFRRDWPREKGRIKGELHTGTTRPSLLTRITLEDGDDAVL